MNNLPDPEEWAFFKVKNTEKALALIDEQNKIFDSRGHFLFKKPLLVIVDGESLFFYTRLSLGFPFFIWPFVHIQRGIVMIAMNLSLWLKYHEASIIRPVRTRIVFNAERNMSEVES